MPKYLCFEVELEEVAPRIWRRFLLPQDATFYDLHLAIQHACGWESYHLYLFLDADREVIAGMPDKESGEDDPDAREVPLSSWFQRPGASCTYLYDFGDDWEHKVALVGTETEPAKFHQRLLGGERAFPKEDSGGIPGYERFVELLRTGKDPDGDDPKEIMEWLDGWTPEDFDLAEVKREFDR